MPMTPSHISAPSAAWKSRIRSGPTAATTHIVAQIVTPNCVAPTEVLAQTEEDVPWQRVVRADGSLAKGSSQRDLLVAEGVPFSGARVDMGEALFPAEELTPIPPG